MKILLVGRTFYPNIGGVESSLDYISHAFVGAGHSVTILTSLLTMNQNYYERWDKGIDIVRIPIKGKGLKNTNYFQTAVLPLFLSYYYRKELKTFNEEYDLIVCRDTVLAHIFAEKYGKDKVVYIPAVVVKNYRWKIHLHNIRKAVGDMIMYAQLSIDWLFQKKCFEKYQCVVFSDNMKNQISKVVKKAENIRVIYPGTKYSVTKTEKKSQNETCNFLYVGRVDVEKNVDMLIKAYSKCDQIMKSKLIIVGDGNRCNEIKKLVDHLKITDFVIFQGKQKDPSFFYEHSDFLVLPSKYEAFGFVIAEAQTFGVPVIGFKNDGKNVLVATNEIIKEGENGFISEKYSEECLAETMDRAIDVFFTGKYGELCMNSRKKAEELFRWEIFVDKLLDFSSKTET